MIDLGKIAHKWQRIWDENNIFAAHLDSAKPKYYVLEMFPYPSGNIHVGHIRNYSIGDVVARFMKCSGYNVLHPMGFDSFGLPAENAAISNKSHPKTWTYKNIETMKAQLKRIGFSYDWDKEIATCDPDYYKYEQEFFLELYNRGIAYQKDSIVNWDPIDQTVLANEQVIDGRGWRSGAVVEKKKIKGWFIKITDYADQLLDGLDKLPGWPDYVKLMQKNWIGKSEGAEIYFDVKNTKQQVEIFTTRPDTIFGASFIGLCYDHEIIDLIPNKSDSMNKFIEECKLSINLFDKDQKAMDTGLRAIHPFDGNKELPILITNFVLKDYGSGAIFGCPGHDQRDWHVAKKLGLPITQVVDNKNCDISVEESPYLGDGTIINSDILNGFSVSEAKIKSTEFLTKIQKGKKTINYKIRDWGVSRQRFWGCPIPIIYCKDCGIVEVPKEDLPILLPDDVVFDGKGNPLENHPTWKHVKCPECKNDATRETDSFDTFFESSWYFARFCDNKAKSMCSKKACDYWMPVDQYIGGVEHAVMHLLYARFFSILMTEGNYMSFNEPFTNLLTQGMVLHETYKDESGGWLFPNEIEKKNGFAINIKTGAKVLVGTMEKMSKSKKNVVDPDEMLENYGADAIRLFCLSDSPPEKDFEWTMSGIDGCKKFIMRLYFIGEKISRFEYKDETIEDKPIRSLVNNTIYNVTNDIKSFNLNKAIARCRELYNFISDLIDKSDKVEIRNAYIVLIKLLNPYIPHITEEIWELLGNKTLLAQESWPEYDAKYLVHDTDKIAIQINGKLRLVQEFSSTITKEDLEIEVLKIHSIQTYILGKEIKKIIIVPGKIVNIVV